LRIGEPCGVPVLDDHLDIERAVQKLAYRMRVVAAKPRLRRDHGKHAAFPHKRGAQNP
jgi:hypothetical protein